MDLKAFLGIYPQKIGEHIPSEFSIQHHHLKVTSKDCIDRNLKYSVTKKTLYFLTIDLTLIIILS